MKIYFLLNQSYPYGYALTKRFHFYAKGIIRNNHQAKIIIPLPTEKEDSINKSTSGIYDNVPFIYTWVSTRRSNSFFFRRIHDLLGSVHTIKLLIREKPDFVVTSAFSDFFYLVLKFVSRFSSFKIIKEKNEIDFLRKDSVTTNDLIRLKISNTFFDGFIVINNLLLSYMNEELKDKKPKIVVPILIDDFRKENKIKVQKTIVYTGTYLERKDGILSILKAFARIRDKFPEYKLILTGSPKQSRDLEYINELIAKERLENDVIFTGYLEEAELQEILLSAGMLILAKPENRQNIYNFPTKIGEYLISGRPVISTRVGIIGELMRDRQDIVFADYDVDDIIRKIEFLITNPDSANSIGRKGRAFALKNFDYLKHTKRMINFFEGFGQS